MVDRDIFKIKVQNSFDIHIAAMEFSQPLMASFIESGFVFILRKKLGGGLWPGRDRCQIG
jgi:hypothetical protein